MPLLRDSDNPAMIQASTYQVTTRLFSVITARNENKKIILPAVSVVVGAAVVSTEMN